MTERRQLPVSPSTYTKLNEQRSKEAARLNMSKIPWLDFMALYAHRPITEEVIDAIAKDLEAKIDNDLAIVDSKLITRTIKKHIK